MRVDGLRPLSIFDGLTDEQLGELLEGGTEVRIEPGVELFREGEHADFWWVLVDGAGLGLDIARRIVVERHGGTIAIDSRPGETVLRVRLPVRPRASSA
jgi:signal transduction histidine kinase